MADPFLIAARRTYALAFDELNSCLDGLTPAQLNWRPEGPAYNSLTALAVHSLGSCWSWLAVAMGAELPARDRQAEFETAAATAEELHDLATRIQGECLTLLERGPSLAWDATRRTHSRPDASLPAHETGAWALIHGLEHLREHLGQMLLTRQLALASESAG